MERDGEKRRQGTAVQGEQEDRESATDGQRRQKTRRCRAKRGCGASGRPMARRVPEAGAGSPTRRGGITGGGARNGLGKNISPRMRGGRIDKGRDKALKPSEGKLQEEVEARTGKRWGVGRYRFGRTGLEAGSGTWAGPEHGERGGAKCGGRGKTWGRSQAQVCEEERNWGQ